jgi:hypothetical protein
MDQLSAANQLPAGLDALYPSNFTTSSAAATTGTAEETSSSLQMLPSGGAAADVAVDDTEIESGQLFGSLSPTPAATASALLSPQQPGSFSGFTRSPAKGRASHDGSGDVDASGAQVAGMWVAGGSQVTRLSLQWAKDSISEATESTVMDQEVRGDRGEEEQGGGEIFS